MAEPVKKTVAQKFEQKSRTSDVLIGENATFASLLLSPAVQEGLTLAGFDRPSPIQIRAIPLGRCGCDLIVQAKSGTGKTCVFAVTALEAVDLKSHCLQVVVLAPTREIAVQISDVIKSLGVAMPYLRCEVFIGGLPLNDDRQKLKHCHIAIATPGRFKQLIDKNAVNVNSVSLFVLDEADKLLEDDFQDDINWIYSSLPNSKQMLAVSATYPEYLAEHLLLYMRSPFMVRLNTCDPALLGISQYVVILPAHKQPYKMRSEKATFLVQLLSSVDFQQCLVFTNSPFSAEELTDKLNCEKWPSAYICGSMAQKDRLDVMERFRLGRIQILISTDLTSRGIDVDNVNLVVNFDLPLDHETYLHRNGRAGRFGSFGAAVTIIGDNEVSEFRGIEFRCQTSVRPLPDPIPEDLAKRSVAIADENLVSVERINQNCEPKTGSSKSDICAMESVEQKSCADSQLIRNDILSSVSASLMSNDEKNESLKFPVKSSVSCGVKLTRVNNTTLDNIASTSGDTGIAKIVDTSLKTKDAGLNSEDIMKQRNDTVTGNCGRVDTVDCNAMLSDNATVTKSRIRKKRHRVQYNKEFLELDRLSNDLTSPCDFMSSHKEFVDGFDSNAEPLLSRLNVKATEFHHASKDEEFYAEINEVCLRLTDKYAAKFPNSAEVLGSYDLCDDAESKADEIVFVNGKESQICEDFDSVSELQETFAALGSTPVSASTRQIAWTREQLLAMEKLSDTMAIPPEVVAVVQELNIRRGTIYESINSWDNAKRGNVKGRFRGQQKNSNFSKSREIAENMVKTSYTREETVDSITAAHSSDLTVTWNSSFIDSKSQCSAARCWHENVGIVCKNANNSLIYDQEDMLFTPECSSEKDSVLATSPSVLDSAHVVNSAFNSVFQAPNGPGSEVVFRDKLSGDFAFSSGQNFKNSGDFVLSGSTTPSDSLEMKMHSHALPMPICNLQSLECASDVRIENKKVESSGTTVYSSATPLPSNFLKLSAENCNASNNLKLVASGIDTRTSSHNDISEEKKDRILEEPGAVLSEASYSQTLPSVSEEIVQFTQGDTVKQETVRNRYSISVNSCSDDSDGNLEGQCNGLFWKPSESQKCEKRESTRKSKRKEKATSADLPNEQRNKGHGRGAREKHRSADVRDAGKTWSSWSFPTAQESMPFVPFPDWMNPGAYASYCWSGYVNHLQCAEYFRQQYSQYAEMMRMQTMAAQQAAYIDHMVASRRKDGKH